LKSPNGSPQSVVLFGSILLSHAKTMNAKVVTFLIPYTERSHQKAQILRVVIGEQPKNKKNQ